MIVLTKNRIFPFLYSVVLFLFLINCYACSSDSKRNIKAYYLPLNELADGLVYEYQAINNEQLPPFYWYFRTTQIKDQTILSGQYFDYQFRIQQLTKEEIVSNGVF